MRAEIRVVADTIENDASTRWDKTLTYSLLSHVKTRDEAEYIVSVFADVDIGLAVKWGPTSARNWIRTVGKEFLSGQALERWFDLFNCRLPEDRPKTDITGLPISDPSSLDGEKEQEKKETFDEDFYYGYYGYPIP